MCLGHVYIVLEPLLPSLLPSPSFSPTPTRKGGVLLPEGVGLLLARPLLAAPPPFEPLYTEARGTPRDTS